MSALFWSSPLFVLHLSSLLPCLCCVDNLFFLLWLWNLMSGCSTTGLFTLLGLRHSNLGRPSTWMPSLPCSALSPARHCPQTPTAFSSYWDADSPYWAEPWGIVDARCSPCSEHLMTLRLLEREEETNWHIFKCYLKTGKLFRRKVIHQKLSFTTTKKRFSANQSNIYF